jgi:hypothetical protein
MVSTEFRTNRLNFPQAELDQYRGQWVAFRADGRTIVAHAGTFAELLERLAAQGLQPEEVVFEGIPDEDMCLGAEEL